MRGGAVCRGEPRRTPGEQTTEPWALAWHTQGRLPQTPWCNGAGSQQHGRPGQGSPSTRAMHPGMVLPPLRLLWDLHQGNGSTRTKANL
jgi:hypothetical protein